MTSYVARVCYLGGRYHGSQYQPGLNTIQSELIEAVNKWSGHSHSTQTIQLAGRTDRGVHSIGQIVQIVTEKSLDIDRINRHLPWDITLWAYAPAPINFRPRFDALMRHYRYYFDTALSTLDIPPMRRSLQLILGSHNFHQLAKPDGNRPTTATILNACLIEHNGTLVLDLFGTNFLWKLVRKTVSLLQEIGEGKSSPSLTADILSGQSAIPSGIRPAPPENLVLVETVISLRMKPSEFAIKRIHKHIGDHLRFLDRFKLTLAAVNNDYLSSLRDFP
ncbi:MAG: tRNA pseudouridine(38-40) synthase TruA [Promethearchaeota archaeon]